VVYARGADRRRHQRRQCGAARSW